MNRYFALSCGLHLSLALLIVVILAPSAQKAKTTYTIDFIGSGKVVAMQASAKAGAAEQAKAKTEVKKEVAQAPAPKKETAKKADKKAYQSKSEISTKKQTKKKAKPAPAPLAAPSILDEVDDNPKVVDTNSSQPSSEGGEGEFEGGNIQTDFATFPYPWYITQVRNSLWSEWESRRPVGVALGTLVSFAIARDGKIKDLKIEKSSGDDSFDFAARSAVINAGPFPPLPMLYDKDELTVTVEFKQEK